VAFLVQNQRLMMAPMHERCQRSGQQTETSARKPMIAFLALVSRRQSFVSA
jgi:hypothetical protein